MKQLSIFDELSRQDSEARRVDTSAAGYVARYDHGELIPGEACPACGHIFERGGYDGSQCHYLTAGTSICSGMRAERRHLAMALSDDPQWSRGARGDEAERAIDAGWPESTVRAWQADPRELLRELDTPRRGVALEVTRPDGTHERVERMNRLMAAGAVHEVLHLDGCDLPDLAKTVMRTGSGEHAGYSFRIVETEGG